MKGSLYQTHRNGVVLHSTAAVSEATINRCSRMYHKRPVPGYWEIASLLDIFVLLRNEPLTPQREVSLVCTVLISGVESTYTWMWHLEEVKCHYGVFSFKTIYRVRRVHVSKYLVPLPIQICFLYLCSGVSLLEGLYCYLNVYIHTH